MASKGRSGTSSDKKEGAGGPETSPPGMSSSGASGPTAAGLRRILRKSVPESRRAKGQRLTSRDRMSLYRAKEKALKNARLLKLPMDDEERATVEARSARKRQEVLCDWFRSNTKVAFNKRMQFTREIMDSFMSKVEIHQVDLTVAEYEIAIITDASKRAILNELQEREKKGGSIGTRDPTVANSSRDRAFGGGNDQAPSTTAREGGGGKPIEKCAAADSTSTQASVCSSFQEPLKGEIKHDLRSQISPARPPDSAGMQATIQTLSNEQANDFLSCISMITGEGVGGHAVNEGRGVANALQGLQKKGGSIGTLGLADTNSTHARAFGGNDQAPLNTKGDGVTPLEKCAAADFDWSSAPVRQISDDGSRAPPGLSDPVGTQEFDPRFSDEQVNDFLSCFGGTLAEESASVAHWSSSNLSAFGDFDVPAMPKKNNFDHNFSIVPSVRGEAFPVILPPNKDEGAGPARAFGESDLADTAPLSAGAETVPLAFSRSVFGEEGPVQARPSETAGVRGDGFVPAGGVGGVALSGGSVDGDGDGFDAGEYSDLDLFQW